MDLLNEFKEYLFSQEIEPSKLTVKNYLSDLGHFIRWAEKKSNAEFNPSLITSAVLDEYRIEFAEVFSQSSIDRHFSSLRKFFKFLKLQGKISSSPLEIENSKLKIEEDPWRLKDFKNHLYVSNSSHLTIKNYIIDVRQFLNWAKEVTGIGEDQLLSHIDAKFVEEYKNRLVNSTGFSPATVNRKLSSLRKYLSWASAENLVVSREYSVDGIYKAKSALNLPKAQPIQITDYQLPATNYSKIPPIRLIQKIANAGSLAFDSILISPLASLASKGQDVIWKIKGQPIFVKGPQTLVSKNITPQDLLGIRNISKAIYAPFNISTKSLPFIKRIIFHARYTRPKWYKVYHSYAITHYFHFAVLIIFLAAVGFGLYNSFFAPQQKLLAANPNLPAAPNRVLSFQGRLTDSNDNPITSPTWIRYQIYRDPGATGAGTLLWQEVQRVSPDTDGIFNSLLGNTPTSCPNPTTPATGACAIPSTLFSENNALFLGVTIEATPELTPRQQIATVAFAANSETLQGLPPITATNSATTNVVLALDSSGNLTIGGSANPVFSASGGTFKLSGQPLLLTTNLGSANNIQVVPDGLGKIDVQKALVNTSINGNLKSSDGSYTTPGAVEINDEFGVLATSSGRSAFTVNQDSVGPLISASTSGVAKFTIDNSGNQTLAGNSTIAGTTGVTFSSTGGINLAGGTLVDSVDGVDIADALEVSGLITANGGLTVASGQTTTFANFNANNNVLYATVTTGVLAGANTSSIGYCLLSGASAPSWAACPGGGGDGLWRLSQGAISSVNDTVDVLIGGISTSSAKFAFTGLSSLTNQTQASISGQLIVMPNNGFGNVGIGTVTPTSALTLGSTSGLAAGGILFGTDTNLYRSAADTLKTDDSLVIAGGNLSIGTNESINGLITFFSSGVGVTDPTISTDATGNLLLQGAGGDVTFTLGAGEKIYIDATTTPNTTTVGVLDLAVTSSTNNNKAAAIGTTFTSTGATTSYGLSNVWASSAVVVGGGVSQTGYGIYNTSTKTGADTATGTYTLYGSYNTASNTGRTDAGTVNTYGSYITATGDTNGTSTATGLYVSATGADNNYAAIFNTGLVGIGTTTPNSELYVTRALSQGATGKALAIFDQIENQDIFTASYGGTTKFTISNTGSITDAAYTGQNAVLYGTQTTGVIAQATTASSSQCLLSGASAPSWAACPGGAPTTDLYWNQTLGALYPNNSTVDFLIGGQSTASALFSFTGVSNLSNQTKASISGQLIVMPNNGFGNVGIGTVTPVGKLDVSGAATGKALAIFNETGDQNILTASASGTTRFVIASSGNLLGTVSSTADPSTGGLLGLGLRNSDTTSSSLNGILFSAADTGSTSRHIGAIVAGKSDSWTAADTTTWDSFLSFWTRLDGGNEAERMRIAANGNVGIGTTAPASLLHIANTTSTAPRGFTSDQYSNDAAGSLISIRKSRNATVGSHTIVQSGDSLLNISAYGSDGTGFITAATILAAVDGTPGTNDMPGRLQFYTTADGAAAATERMRIDNAGNVGIGTVTPDTKLHVIGGLCIESSDANCNSYTPAGGTIYAAALYDVNNSAYYVDPAGGTSAILSGNVGIGTTTPRTTLDLTGSASISANLAFNGSGTTHTVSTFDGGNINFDMVAGGSGAGKTTLYLKTSGNLGIGTTSPISELHVTRPLSFGTTGKALAIFDQIENQDIFTASNSGTTRFSLGVYGNATQSAAVTTMNGYTLNANTLTTGTGFYLSSTSTGLTTGGLMALDWSPSSATTATGDLLSLNIGANGILGNIFNVKDNGSSVFSVSQTAITGNLPTSFTAAGDVAIAYDINFTNPTSSFIKSAAPLYITAGETFNSSDLNLSTYNKGNVVVNTEAFSVVGSATVSAKFTLSSAMGTGTGGNYLCINTTTYEVLRGNGSACTASSARFKENINNLGYGLSDVMKLRAVSFNYKPEFNMGSGLQVGFIAEEVKNVIPELVSYDKDGLASGVNYPNMTAVLTQAIQEQQLMIASSQTKIASMEADLALTTSGNLNIIQNNPDNYSVVKNNSETVTRIAALEEAVIGNIRAGFVNAQKITTVRLQGDALEARVLSVTDSITIAGESLHDYIATIVNDVLQTTNYQLLTTNIISPIASIDQIHTNLISPLAQNSDSKIAVKLNDNEGKSKFEVQNASGSAVASIDSEGKLSASEASISGTLRAQRIIADQIDLSSEALAKLEGLNIQTATLSANYITNNYYSATQSAFPTLSASPSGLATIPNTLSANSYINIASYSSQLAYVENLNGATATFSQGLTVYGTTTLSDTSIVGQLSISGSLILADNSINVLGSDLSLQPLRQGGISIMADLIHIDTNGNVKFGGFATFEKDVTVKGNLAVNSISPLLGKDLNINLASQSASKLVVNGASNSAVLSLDNLGNLVASGTGTFAKLNLGNLVEPAFALSNTEVVATGSAGTLTLKSNTHELTINNTLVTDKSLIYITPISDTLGQNLYLLRQVPDESFTVGISVPIPKDIKFNYLIIN